tara:strand:+ start:138 stop:476 length:339 start_codon:yes stop_codon:yes gene_type:complete
MSEILAHKKTAVVEELWRRAKVITAEWEKEPFSHMLSSQMHVDALLAPIGYPFVASEEEGQRYPWIVDENKGAIMTGEDYAWYGYDEDLDQIRNYIWEVVMPYYDKIDEEVD